MERQRLNLLLQKTVNDIIRPLEKESRNREAVYGMIKAMITKAAQWGFMSINPCAAVEPPHH